jgi:branched-chain amino acid transport system ATP-binding protein
MLAIGRALMSGPRLLLLDEPSLGLAPQMVARIGRVIREIHAQGTAVVLVEQNATMALAVADYAAVLEVGRIALSGPAAELAASEDVQRLYLGGHAESQAQADAEREEAQTHRPRRELSRWTG